MCSWYEHGEKSSKHFLTLEKGNKAKPHVCTLLTESSNECTDPSEIMIKVKGFYSNLYKCCSMKTEEDCFEYLRTINIPQLSEAERISWLTNQEGMLESVNFNEKWKKPWK